MSANLESLLSCLEYFVYVKDSVKPSNKDEPVNQHRKGTDAVQSDPHFEIPEVEFNSIDQGIPLWLTLIIDALEETILTTTFRYGQVKANDTGNFITEDVSI